mgnify:CR=1 FL=1
MLANKLYLKYAAIGLVQGLVFITLLFFEPTTLLFAAVKHGVYYASLFMLLSYILILPKKLTVTQIRQVVIIGLLMGGLATWLYTQQYPTPGYQSRSGVILFAWSLLAVLLAYIVLPFIQSQSLFKRRSIDYSALYRHSWDNFFVLSLAGLFMLIYWLMIVLSIFLFEMLAINQVKDFLLSPSFLLLTMPIMFSIGVRIGHEHERVISTIRFIALSICRFLLPLSAFISVIFAITLLFTGLEPLWETGVSTHALLWLIVVNLVFINGVYQDGSNTVNYPLAIKVLVNLALIALVLFAFISVYSVYLRIDQYGLTPKRIYIMIISGVAALYTVTYAWAAISSFRSKLGNHWLEQIKTPNVVIAYLVAGLIIIMHSPFMDVYNLSARNQFNRVLDPATDLERFDFGVLNYRLGNPGLEYLARLDTGLEDGSLALDEARSKKMKQQLALLSKSKGYYQWKNYLREGNQLRKKHRVTSIDPEKTIPEELTRAFDLYYCRDGVCEVLFVDLTRNGQDEAIILNRPTSWGRSRIYALQDDKSWKHVADLKHRGTDVAKAIHEGRFLVTEPAYKTLVIKGKELQIELVR